MNETKWDIQRGRETLRRGRESAGRGDGKWAEGAWVLKIELHRDVEKVTGSRGDRVRPKEGGIVAEVRVGTETSREGGGRSMLSRDMRAEERKPNKKDTVEESSQELIV
jgi:hypothetical protein